MHSDIRPGLTYELREHVTDSDTALALGSGTLPVLGTPRLTAMMENASMLAVLELLEPGYTTVGVKVSIEHIAPTAPGMNVRIVSVLRGVDGRRLTYDVEAYSGDTRIGCGTHERVIIHAGRFMSRIDG